MEVRTVDWSDCTVCLFHKLLFKAMGEGLPLKTMGAGLPLKPWERHCPLKPWERDCTLKQCSLSALRLGDCILQSLLSSCRGVNQMTPAGDQWSSICRQYQDDVIIITVTESSNTGTITPTHNHLNHRISFSRLLHCGQNRVHHLPSCTNTSSQQQQKTSSSSSSSNSNNVHMLKSTGASIRVSVMVYLAVI